MADSRAIISCSKRNARLQDGRPFWLIQAPTDIGSIGEGPGRPRIIYINSKHVDGLRPHFIGDSTAIWDGDALVIDTVNMAKETLIANDGTPHSDALHVTERWRLIGDCEMEMQLTMDDPEIFKRHESKKARYDCPATGVLLRARTCIRELEMFEARLKNDGGFRARYVMFSTRSERANSLRWQPVFVCLPKAARMSAQSMRFVDFRKEFVWRPLQLRIEG